MKMMKGDGNGNLVIPGWFLTVILIMIAILSSVASVVAMGTTLRNDVDTLKTEWAEASPRHTEVIEKIEDRIGTNEKSIATADAQIESMCAQLDRIENKIDKLYEVKQ